MATRTQQHLPDAQDKPNAWTPILVQHAEVAGLGSKALTNRLRYEGYLTTDRTVRRWLSGSLPGDWPVLIPALARALNIEPKDLLP